MSSVPAVLHVCIVMVCCVISVPHGRACVHCVMSDGDVVSLCTGWGVHG